MQISKKEFESYKKRFKTDEKFNKAIIRYYQRYWNVPDPELLLDIKGVGSVTMNGFRKRTKRTYKFVLDDGRSGDVFHNKGQFIVRIDGENAKNEEDYKLIKDLVIIGYYGAQAVIAQETEDKNNEHKTN